MAQKKMGYTLYVNGPYKQRDGSAITSTSTDVDGGAAKNVGTTSNGLRNSALGLGKNEGPKVVGGVGFGTAQIGTYLVSTGHVGVTGITNASSPFAGLAQINHANHGLNSGSVVWVRHNPEVTTGTYNGAFRVVAVPSIGVAVINARFKDTITGIAFATGVGVAGSQTPGQYTMRKQDGVVHGIPNTIMRSAASDFGRRKVHSITALRSTLVATAIRSGQYDIFTGKFDRALTTQNDYNSLDTQNPSANLPDDEAQGSALTYGLNGEFNYRAGAVLPTSGDYEIKHT